MRQFLRVLLGLCVILFICGAVFLGLLALSYINEHNAWGWFWGIIIGLPFVITIAHEIGLGILNNATPEEIEYRRKMRQAREDNELNYG